MTIMLLFGIAFLGGFIVLLSFISIFVMKFSKPKKELQKKVADLEREVLMLKNKKQ